MTDTTVPRGTAPSGDIIRLAASQASRKNTLNAMDAGITYLLSDPSIILMMCGAISPTKPMIPAQATITAMMSAITNRQMILRDSVSSPRLVAALSPSARTLSCLDMAMIMMAPTVAMRAVTTTPSQPVLATEPTCHW
jgi:hypothetical protein